MELIFVCKGNICRSPAAEATAKDYLERKDMETVNGDTITIKSYGTSDYNMSVAPHKHTIKAAEERWIHIDHESQVLNVYAIDAADYIIAMDRHNYNEITRMRKSAESKTFIFRESDPERTKHYIEDVPDPFGEEYQVFKDVQAIIARTIPLLMNKFIQDYKRNRKAS